MSRRLALALFPLVLPASAFASSAFDASGPTAVDEGSPAVFQLHGAASPAAQIQGTWDFGDGSVATGRTVAHTYLDDGRYDVTVTVPTPTGEVELEVGAVDVANTPPRIVTNNSDRWGGEGAPLVFRGDARDDGLFDAMGLQYRWDFGDGARAEGATTTHAFADDGRYEVTLTVTDPQGAAESTRFDVRVDNTPATVTGDVVGFTDRDGRYRWEPRVSEPGDDAWEMTLLSGPAGMTLDDGVVSWDAPDGAGRHTFTLRLEDEDGAVSEFTTTVTRGWSDSDDDGMADVWEREHGLSVGSVDAKLDADHDGVNNVAEFLAGGDPQRFDGPAAPTFGAPARAASVATFLPELRWNDAVDPQGDAVTYDVEVYADEAMTALRTDARNVQGTSWTLDREAKENTEFHWRVRAHDGVTAGPWSSLHTVFVNVVDEAPEAPAPMWPVDGAVVDDARPLLRWDRAPEGDRDETYFRVVIADAVGDRLGDRVVTGIATMPDLVAWPFSFALDDGDYQWSVAAYDGSGVRSPFARVQRFSVDTTNGAPGVPTFVGLGRKGTIGSTSPTLQATTVADPEGDAVTYRVEFWGERGFEMPVPGRASGRFVSFDLARAGVKLSENRHWAARVVATDALGASTVSEVRSFFVRGRQDAPEAPAMLSPEADEIAYGGVVFEVAGGADPEGDAVTYEVRVSRDSQGTQVFATVTGLTRGHGLRASEGQANWAFETTAVGRVFWSARAVDTFGAESEWSTPRALHLRPASEAPEAVTVASCSSAAGGSPGPAFVVAFLLVAAARRRE